MSTERADSDQPLQKLDDWDDFVKERVYPQPAQKARKDYRNYDAPARPGVREFYRLNHRHQTLEFVQQCKGRYLPLRKREMSVFEALEFLNTLVDDSDPDIEGILTAAGIGIVVRCVDDDRAKAVAEAVREIGLARSAAPLPA